MPLLVDAVRRLDAPELRLVLVGGWASRGMRRFMSTACAEDPRIVVRPATRASSCAAPTSTSTPATTTASATRRVEALAAGVPAIVTEDTGMKELIAPGRGLVLPTGDVDALAEALAAAYRREILSL